MKWPGYVKLIIGSIAYFGLAVVGVCCLAYLTADYLSLPVVKVRTSTGELVSIETKDGIVKKPKSNQLPIRYVIEYIK